MYHEMCLSTSCWCGVGFLGEVGRCWLSDPFCGDDGFEVCRVGCYSISLFAKATKLAW